MRSKVDRRLPSSAFSGPLKGRNTAEEVAGSLIGWFRSCFMPHEMLGLEEDESSGASDQRHAPTRLARKTHSGSNARESINLNFTFQEIVRATQNFSPSLKIGQGGSATVYKGTLKDGSVVAVKRARKSLFGDHASVEFHSEIRTLARVEHLNLVKFVGCLEGEDERIVVEEFISNGTLKEHLECKHTTVLDLGVRLDIAIDVAHAVTYLHLYSDNAIIHRDIKSSNILLTENFRAKVADFGFARLVADDDYCATHISTQVKGSAGYLDPDYLKTYQLTEKSDVYSFGVLLVELITGRRPIEAQREGKERITIRWAREKFTDECGMSAMDPRLPRTPANSLAVERTLELAWRCLLGRRQARPSMQECAQILWQIRMAYKELLSAHGEGEA